MVYGRGTFRWLYEWHLRWYIYIWYISVYRSPNSNENDAIDIIETFLEKIVDLRNTTVIMGDINIDFAKQTNKCAKLIRIFDSHGMKHTVSHNTQESRIQHKRKLM